MKPAVLSRQPRSYSTRRLVAAAHERSHDVEILDTLPGADLIDQTIRVGLSDRDISVPTLVRGDHVVPNPREDRVLEVEDRLLCFGKLSEMRSLIPARRRRRARPKPQPLPSDPFADVVAGMPDRVVHGA